MTRVYLHSTDPEHAAKINPAVFEKILAKRKAAEEQLGKVPDSVKKITLEIGCGHGHFLTAYAEKNPGEFCIGVDLHRGRIFKSIKKAERAGLKNLMFIESDSTEFLTLITGKLEITKTWILYPDPWPKKRHFKNRIVQGEFLKRLASLTQAGGELWIRSDYRPFIDWSHDLLNESDGWLEQQDFIWPELGMTVFQELTENKHNSLKAILQE